MKKFLSAAALLLSAALAQAQNVQQSGSVTAGHAVQWVGSGVVKDAGTAANGSLTSLGVTNNGGPGICVQSAIPTAAARNQLCLSVTTNGGAKLSSYSYGTATNAGFSFDVNGVLQGFPTVNLPVAAGNGTCFLNTSGTLTDCGFVPVSPSAIAPNIYSVVCDATGVAECAHFGTQLAACEAGGGGEVIFPHGYFLLNAGYTINGACIIRGQGWQLWQGTGTTFTPGTIGTWLKQTTITNSMLTNAAGSNGAQIRDLAIWQTQTADASFTVPTAYPPVLQNNTSSITISHVLLFGVTKGFKFGTVSGAGSGDVYMHDIQGACFTTCIEVAKSGDIINLDRTYFHSYIVGSLSTNMLAYIQANAVAYKSGRSDTPFNANMFTFGFRYGIQIEGNVDGTTSEMKIVNNECDVCGAAYYTTVGGSGTASAQITNMRATGTAVAGTDTRGVYCGSACILQITNLKVQTVTKSGFECGAACVVALTNANINSCNTSNTSLPPIYANHASADITVTGEFVADGTFCTKATSPGAGILTNQRFRNTAPVAFDLIITSNDSTMSTNRTLAFKTNNQNLTMNMGGNVTFGNAFETIGQFTTAGPTALPAIVQGDLWYGSAVGTISALAKNASATRYLSNTGTTNNPAWAQIDLSNGVTGDLPFANLTQGSARSVLGVTGNSTADVASIQGAAGQILGVPNAGTSLAFTATPQLGLSGTLGSLTFGNATSGLLTLQPVTGALGTVTVSLPAATDTLVGKATTDALTNKTVNGLTITTSTGTLTVPNGVTLTGPASSGTAMTLGNTETVSGAKTFTNQNNFIQSSDANISNANRFSRLTNDSYVAIGYDNALTSFAFLASYGSTGGYLPFVFKTNDTVRMTIQTDATGAAVNFAYPITTTSYASIGTKIRATGTAPALTSCGTSPAISGSDLAGEVTMGTGAPTGCVITFNVAYSSAPYCTVSWQSTPLLVQSYVVSTAAITLTQTATSSNKINYTCVARSAG